MHYRYWQRPNIRAGLRAMLDVEHGARYISAKKYTNDAICMLSFTLGWSIQFCTFLLYPGQWAVFANRASRWRIIGKYLTENNPGIRLNKWPNRNRTNVPVPPWNKVVNLLHLFIILQKIQNSVIKGLRVSNRVRSWKYGRRRQRESNLVVNVWKSEKNIQHRKVTLLG
jgi:hypothetical protein